MQPERAAIAMDVIAMDVIAITVIAIRESAMQVGFVGVGRMGKAMAINLLKAGHRLRVWDTSPQPLHELEQAGAEIAANAGEAFHGDALISMLPNDDAVRGMFADGSIFPPGGSST